MADAGVEMEVGGHGMRLSEMGNERDGGRRLAEMEGQQSKVDVISHMLASWRDVSDVETLRMAAGGLISVLDSLLTGLGPAHGIILNDVHGNTEKILGAAQALGVKTVKEMVRKEIEQGLPFRDSGREALLWLKRTLQFVRRTVIRALEDPRDNNLAKCMKLAYNETLAPCHGLRAHAFRLFMGGAPSKLEFFHRICPEASSPDVVILGLTKWLELSEPVVSRFVSVCNAEHIETQMSCQEV